MNIDLSKFKKIECDGKCSTLQHPSGHTLKIAHKGLSGELRKQLDDLPMHMAKGGYAKYAQKYDPNQKSKNSKPSQPAKSSDKSPEAYMAPKEAEHTYSEPPDQGTDISLKSLKREAPPFGPINQTSTARTSTGAIKQYYPPCINPSCKSYGKSHPNCLCYGGARKGDYLPMAEGGEVENYCGANRMHFKGCEYYSDGGDVQQSPPPQKPPVDPNKAQVAQDSMRKAFHFKSGGVAPGEEDGDPNEVPDRSYRPAMADEIPDVPDTPAQVPQEDDVASINPNPQRSPALQETKPSSESSSTPQEPTPAEQLSQEPEPQTPAQAAQQHGAAVTKKLMDEDKYIQADINSGFIKPDSYQDLFNKKDTLGKIGTIFGLLIGSAGAGLAHQPNMLMQMMRDELTNDNNAKVQSANNMISLLKSNQGALTSKANARQTNAAANAVEIANRNMMKNRFALDHLVKITQKLPEGSPQKNEANRVLTMLHQDVDTKNSSTAALAGMAQAMAHFSNSSDRDDAKAMSSGIMGQRFEKMGQLKMDTTHDAINGEASRPLSPEDRGQIDSGLEFDRAIKNFRDWSSKHSGDLSPSDIKYGRALAADVQGSYRKATHGGVYKEGEQNFISKIINDTPTEFMNKIRVLPQLNAVIDSNKLRLDQVLKNKGFTKGYGAIKQDYQPQSSSNSTMQGKIAVNSQGHRIMYNNGKWQPVNGQ